MVKKLVQENLLFEVKDVFGRSIRTTKDYWLKITTFKHRELQYGVAEVTKTLTNPDEVRRSVTDATILLFAKKMRKYDILIAAVKVLNGEGFLVTCYQTKAYKKKGALVWEKQKMQ